MSEISVVVRARDPGSLRLPVLDPDQESVCRAAGSGSVVVQGAPGSGRTTCALGVLARAVEGGESALLWAPDRVRVGAVEARAQALAPRAVRPVRTPAAFAHLVVSTWRVGRADPLGPVELVTGTQEDQAIAELLAADTGEWPASMPEAMRAMPAFRMEVRNLFARAGEAGIDGEGLERLGERFGRAEWVAAGRVLRAYESAPGADLETRGPLGVDTSRIQHLAARVLADWEREAPARGVTAPPPRPDVVVVDDLQDCTPATVELLAVMSGLGTRVVAFADPDVAVASYRGGEPHLDRRLARELGVDTLQLGDVHRGGAALRDLARAVTGRITTTGPAARRRVGVRTGAPAADDVRIHLAAGDAQLGALAARLMRSHHLHDGIAWEDQVVIVRSSGQVAAVRRLLARGGVPLAGRGRAFAFADEPVTRTLLDLVSSGLPSAGPAVGGGASGPAGGATVAEDAPMAGHSTGDQSELALRLLESPCVRADPLDVHRLLRRLNSEVVAAGDGDDPDDDGSDVMAAGFGLVDLLEDPAPALGAAGPDLAAAVARASAMWRARQGAWRMRPRQALWALWEAADVAEDWRRGALAGDGDSAWFDDQLDAVIALFRVADVWEQRTPEGLAGDFARQLLADRVPVDTIARTGERPPGVDVLTPAQAMGREWSVVCVLGLQDGRWPNLRLRDRVLRADLLADVAAGRTGEGPQGEVLLDDPRSARRAVLDDETRLFAAAVTRSRCHLHLGAVSAEQEAPSEFVDLSRPWARVDEVDGRIRLERVPAPLDLPGQVATLRHLAAQAADTPERDVATTLLAVLAGEGVSAADPTRWTGVGGISTGAVVEPPGPVVVSPSKVESARDCALRWFLASSGGSVPAGGAQQLGTVVHAIAQRHPHGSLDVMLDELHEAWEDLGYDATTWVGEQQMRHSEDVVRALADYMSGVPGEVRTEVPVSRRVGDVVVRGSIDRVEVVDGGVRIVDLKTGGNAVSVPAAEAHPQLATYQVALVEGGEPVVGARLEYLGSGKPVLRSQAALDEDGLAAWRAELDAVGALMRGPTYVATPSESVCRYCPFARSCPARGQGRRTLA